MSKRLFIDAIDARIIAQVSEFKDVQLWNSQLDNEPREEAREYPRIYLEFQEIIWQTRAKGVQVADVILTVHNVIEKYTTDDRDHLDLVDKVFIALNLYAVNNLFSGLVRIGERQDTNHDNCIDFQTDYSCQLIDCTASTVNPQIEIPGPVDLEINTDLDIDNIEIRTGDGTF